MADDMPGPRRPWLREPSPRTCSMGRAMRAPICLGEGETEPWAARPSEHPEADLEKIRIDGIERWSFSVFSPSALRESSIGSFD
jgi:hypothetical protein